MQVCGSCAVSRPVVPQRKKSQRVKAGLGVTPAAKAVPWVCAAHARLSAGGDVALYGVSAVAEEMFFHLALEVFTGAQVGQVQTVFIDQHGLLLDPISPCLLADGFINAFAQLAWVRWQIEALCFGAEFDALNGA
jgi:hypothetical protein